MKKPILIIMLILITSAAVAEESEFKPFKSGIAAYTGASILTEGYDQQGLWLAGIVHITPRIAIRPQFLLLIKDEESRIGFPTSAIDSYYDDLKGVGIDLFYYWPRSSRSLLYAGPSFRFLQYKDEADNDSGTFSRNKTDNFRYGIVFGGQHMFDEYFGFFGDIGIGIDTSHEVKKDFDSSGNLTDEDTNISTIYASMGARLGGVFYFN